MGVELEYQVDKHRQRVGYMLGDKLHRPFALMKDDGSVYVTALRLYTRPASGYCSTHAIKLVVFLDGLPEWIHPHASCGMHVHISRTAFTWSNGCG